MEVLHCIACFKLASPNIAVKGALGDKGAKHINAVRGKVADT